MKCELREYCSLYLLGVLEPQERTNYEQHLLLGCEECSEELSLLSEAVEALVMTDIAVTPRAEVKEQLLNRIHQKRTGESHYSSSQVWKQWQPFSHPRKGLVTMRSDEGAWQDIGIEGISVKQLFSDPDHHTITMLVRMAAGTTYPSHRHGGIEECYVLEGDLHVGDELLLHSGDYQRADDDSIHLKQWTENGCLLFIVSSTDDELLE